jgi:hypothetical protein
MSSKLVASSTPTLNVRPNRNQRSNSGPIVAILAYGFRDHVPSPPALGGSLVNGQSTGSFVTEGGTVSKGELVLWSVATSRTASAPKVALDLRLRASLGGRTPMKCWI